MAFIPTVSSLFGPVGMAADVYRQARKAAAAPIHAGSWRIGSFRLPDIGVTEVFAKERTPEGGSDIFRSRPAPEITQPSEQLPAPGPAPSPTGQVAGAVTGTLAPAPAPQQLGGGETGPSMRDIIEQEFQQVQSYLGGVEETSKKQAERARQQVLREYGQLEQELPKERALRERELESMRQQTGLDVQQATTRIKQMLSDLQNRNMAFLASRGGGAFASSLGAAVGERLGRVAQQQIGGLEAERVRALNTINTEAERVKQFFDKKLSDIQLSRQRALENIQSQLEQKLSQIAGFKYESARAKATEYLNAWREYINSRRMLQVEAYNAFQELQNWALEKGQTLEQARNFALRGVPRINPAAFGVVPPTQPLGAGLGEQPFSFWDGVPSTVKAGIPQSGVQISVRGGKKEEEEELGRQLSV